MRSNRKEIPKIMKIVKGIPEFSSKFISYKGNTMISYIRKKNLYVLLLSNFHHTTETADDIKIKPSKVIQDYNKQKSGVDSVDQQITAFRPCRSTRRWPCVIFSDLIAFAIHAAWVIYQLKYPNSPLVKQKNRKEFLYQLGHQLVTPLIKRRKSSPDYRYLHRDVKLSMDFMIKLCEDSYLHTISLLDRVGDSQLVVSGSGSILPHVAQLCTPTPTQEVPPESRSEDIGLPIYETPQSIQSESGTGIHSDLTTPVIPIPVHSSSDLAIEYFDVQAKRFT